LARTRSAVTGYAGEHPLSQEVPPAPTRIAGRGGDAGVGGLVASPVGVGERAGVPILHPCWVTGWIAASGTVRREWLTRSPSLPLAAPRRSVRVCEQRSPV